MRRVLSALFLLVIILTQASAAAAQSSSIANRPAITIDEAIGIAKAFAATKNIDVSKHYIDSAQLNHNPRGDRGKYWEVRWEESQPTCKGCNIVVVVFMDRSAERIFSK